MSARIVLLFALFCSFGSNQSNEPTLEPTIQPTLEPTMKPTLEPTNEPTMAVNEPTLEPTIKSTLEPTTKPTFEPTMKPTSEPTTKPTLEPTIRPTLEPTDDPTNGPTNYPSSDPTRDPSKHPTMNPTMSPSVPPTTSPTVATTQHVSRAQEPSVVHIQSSNASSSYITIMSTFIVVLVLLIMISLWFWFKYSQKIQADIQPGDIMMRDDVSDTAELVDLIEWFTNTLQLPQYLVHFVQKGYYTLAKIKDIEHVSEIKECGIGNPQHQQQIMEAIHVLKGGNNQNMQTQNNVQRINIKIELESPQKRATIASLPDLPSATRPSENTRNMMDFYDDSAVLSSPLPKSSTPSLLMQKIRVLAFDKDALLFPNIMELNDENESIVTSDSSSSGNSEDMFVKEDLEESSKNIASPAPSTEATKATKQTTSGEVAFDGTKGEYYDEYHHEIYAKRMKNPSPSSQ